MLLILSGDMEGAVACALLLSTLTVLASCHQDCFIGSENDPQSGKPGCWFLPYKDPCKCTAIRLGGMNIPASSYLQGAPYYLDKLLLSEDPEEIQAIFGCPTGDCADPEPLGLENGNIPDDRISASGEKDHYPASHGRLNNPDSFWRPNKPKIPGHWIEVDLLNRTLVAGAIIQGAIDTWRVTHYNVFYSRDRSSDLESVTDAAGNAQMFVGNVRNATIAVTNMFHQSIVATRVRIEPVAWEFGVSIRFELLGCRLQ